MTFIDRLKPGSSTLFKHAIKKQQLKRIHLDVFSPSVHNDVKQRHLKTEVFENGAFCLRVSKTGFLTAHYSAQWKRAKTETFEK